MEARGYSSNSEGDSSGRSLSPSNFRPITLAIHIIAEEQMASLHHCQWLSGYICSESIPTRYPRVLLSAAVVEAHKKLRSLTVCWLDLANAYGSVHHGLIKYALEHYHAPLNFLRVVYNFYTNLNATITCKAWSTRAILLQVGVYQGDPLSVVIFNTVMATLH